jgi:hypothetical protein
MLFPVLLPVLGVTLPPAFPAIPLVILIGWIRGQLLALPECLPSSLAFSTVAIPLVLNPGIQKKKRLAMPTSFPVHGFPPGETINRTSIL